MAATGNTRIKKLALADPAQFNARKKGARTLNTALDDGYTLTERESLRGREILIVTWEIADGYGGRPYATIWGMVQDADDVRRVKFQDGGRSIPAQLRFMAENGVTGDVMVRLFGDDYSFTNEEGEEIDATRWQLLDPNEPDPVQGPADF